MASFDFTDFYIISPDHPRFVNLELIEDEPLRVIIQKYEMILFTNKGELLGDPNFGADLLELLYTTKTSDRFVKDAINEQILLYIPELIDSGYTLDVIFIQDPTSYQDIMFVNLKVSEMDIYAQFGGTI